MNAIVKTAYVLLGLCVVSGAVSAQQQLTLTVEQAIKIGLDNSKALHSSLMKVEAADARVSETNAARLPSLKLGGAYTRLSDVPSFVATIPADAFGPGFPPQQVSFPLSQTVLNNYSLRATIQQPLFTGLRMEKSADLAENTARASEQEYAEDREDLIYNVRSAYWGLYKANEFRKVVDETVTQMEAHLKDVQNFFAQGIVTKNEVLKIEVGLSNTRVLQIDARNNARLAMLALDNVLGIPLTTEIELSSGIQEESGTSEELPALIGRALEERADMKAMEFRVRAGEAAVGMSRSSWFPQIYLVGNYYYARPNQRIIPTVDQFKDTWDIGVSVSMDLWNWGTTIHQTNQAEAQLAQARDGLDQIRDGIALEVTQDYLTLQQSKERVAVAQSAVSQAEENYRVTDEKFKSGLALNSDLLDAEVALMQAKWNHVQSMVDHELADARLRKAVGARDVQNQN